MTAHEVDDASQRLHDLRGTARDDSILAVVSFGLALAASVYRPPLAVPLAAGALAMTVLAIRAFVQEHLLVDDLAAQEDAYRIPEVNEFGRRAASLAHRRELARIIRSVLGGSTEAIGERLEAARPDLERLIAALESGTVQWEPQTVVALEHWLADPQGSFRDASLSGAELRSHVRSVLGSVDSGNRGP